MLVQENIQWEHQWLLQQQQIPMKLLQQDKDPELLDLEDWLQDPLHTMQRCFWVQCGMMRHDHSADPR